MMRHWAGLGLGVFLLLGCNTVGVSRDRAFATVMAQVAQVMLLDSRQLVVFDFRHNSEYWGPDGHIAGALSAPLDTIELRLPELIPYQNNTVLVYGADHEESERGARILAAAGFRNVVMIDGGLRAWLESGYKTVTSP